jgi:hypothetical protein
MLRTSPPDSVGSTAGHDPGADRYRGIGRHSRAASVSGQPRWAWVVAIGGAVVLIGGHLLLGRAMRAPIIHPDELGYLDNARYLAHGGLRPETEYYPGVSLLFVPLWWALRDPFSIWRGALVINSVLAGAGAMVTWLLCGRLAGHLPPRWRLVIAGVVSLYPALLIYSSLALAECLFVGLFGAVVLLAGRAFTGGGRRWWAALGLASGMLVMVHPRGLAVVIAVVIMAALVLRPRRDDGPAALALGAGLAVSLAATRLLVTATRGATTNGFAAYRPDGIISKSLSAHGLVSLLWEAGGQMFYLSVATIGLLPLGLFLGLRSLSVVFRGGRSAKDLMAGFAALSFLGVWALSSLFMNLGDRTDKLVYGRYNEGAIVPLLILALAEVVTAGLSHRHHHSRDSARRWLVIGAATTAITALMVRFGHSTAALHGPLNPINVLGIYPLMRRFGGTLQVTGLAAVGLGLLVVLVLAGWRSPVLVVVLLSGIFLAATADLQSSYLVPGSRARAAQTVIGQTLVRAATQFGLGHECIAVQATASFDFAYYALRFQLPGRQFRQFSPTQGQPACGPLAVSSDPNFASYFHSSDAGQPRLVTLENDTGERLWALPGPLQAQLQVAGWLLPDPTPGVIPALARHAQVKAQGVPAGGLALAPGSSRDIHVLATHDTAGAPWPAAAGLTQGRFAVRMAARWFTAGDGPVELGGTGHYLAQTTVELAHTILPGETASVTIPLIARTGAGSRADPPLPPGHYRVQLTMLQENAPAFSDGGATVDVTVRP